MSDYRGFSLIELLLTLVIVSVLLSIALPSYESYQKRSRLIEGRSALLGLQVELERYYRRYRRYPNSLSELLSQDEDKPETSHAYFTLYMDEQLRQCEEGACYALVAEPLMEGRSTERLELYSDGRRVGLWN